MNKVVANASEACQGIESGMTIMLGGFGLCGIPENCIAEMVRMGVTDLTCISNNAGVDDFGLGLLLQQHQIKKMNLFLCGRERRVRATDVEWRVRRRTNSSGNTGGEMSRYRAGIPAFYTPAGYGTEVAEGKETREFNGKMYVLEKAFDAEFAIVKAWKGDTYGNLVFKGTARNFNPMMAMAGRITIAEVEELVEPGELDPNTIHTPGIFVQRIFQGERYEKRIEQRTVRPRS